MSIFTKIGTSISNLANKLANTGPAGASPYTTKEALTAGVKSAAVAIPITTVAKAPIVISAVATGLSKVPSTIAKYPKISGTIGVTTYLASKSDKLSSDIIAAPKKIDKFATNIGELYDNPTLEQAKKTFEDNPIISSVVVGGTGLLIGKGVSNTIATLSNTAAVRENTKVATAAGSNLIAQYPTSQTATASPLTNSGAVVPNPLTSIGSSNAIKRYKTTKKAKPLYTSPVRITNKIMFFNKNG